MSYFPYIPALKQSKTDSYLSLNSLYWFICREKSIKKKYENSDIKLLLIGSSHLHSTKAEKRADTSRCFPVVPNQCFQGNSKSQLLIQTSLFCHFPKCPDLLCACMGPSNTLQWHTLSKWLPNPSFTPPPIAAFTSGSEISFLFFNNIYRPRTEYLKFVFYFIFLWGYIF